MQSKQPIYIRFGYDNALSSKKELLLAQIEFLNCLKNIKEYQAIRIEELELKEKLQKKIQETIKKIYKIRKNFPEIDKKYIKIIMGEKEQKTVQPKKETEREKIRKSIEQELQEIKEKLAKLN